MRNSAIYVDIYGIDPLRDKISKNLSEILLFEEHTISFSDVGNIDTLAFKYYGKASLGFILLDYNSLGHEMDMVVGETLKIPGKYEVLSLFSSKSGLKSIGTSSTVSI
jgi:hypothetical protein